MEADLRHHLTTCAAAYGSAKGIGLATVARLAAGDWRFFERIEGGASFTARKYDATMAWFSVNWPMNLDWPSDVPRPASAEVAA